MDVVGNISKIFSSHSCCVQNDLDMSNEPSQQQKGNVCQQVLDSSVLFFMIWQNTPGNQVWYKLVVFKINVTHVFGGTRKISASTPNLQNQIF